MLPKNVNTFALNSMPEKKLFATDPFPYKDEKLPQAHKPLSKFEDELSDVNFHLSLFCLKQKIHADFFISQSQKTSIPNHFPLRQF